MQKRLLGAAMGCALMFAGSAALAGECSGTITADEALKAEDARYAAQTSLDFPAMQRVFGDELLYTHSTARTDTKASYIELQRSKAVVYRSMQRNNVNVRTYGCVAIITGRGHYLVTVNGKDGTADLLFTSVWVKRDGGNVQFVSWESTSLPKK